MNWSHWLRQIHRWVSITFTLVVTGIFIAMGLGNQPAAWVFYLPLVPLALLVPTGLYMFALPYVAKRRSGAAEGTR
jgi:hypothetical protein